jgi:hypothetical protein
VTSTEDFFSNVKFEKGKYMNEIKGYYFSNLKLEKDDIVLATIDTDILDPVEVAQDFDRIIKFFAPHKVIGVIKGTDITTGDKKKILEKVKEELGGEEELDENSLEITLNKENLEEIDYIVNNFTSIFASKVAHIESLVFCLQTLMNARDKIKKELEN